MAQDADSLRRILQVSARQSRLAGRVTKPQIGYLNQLLGEVLGRGDAGDVARHQLLEHLFEKRSSKELTKAEASVLIDWLASSQDVLVEAHGLLAAWGKERGQLELEI